jgi:hypothetical protein
MRFIRARRATDERLVHTPVQTSGTASHSVFGRGDLSLGDRALTPVSLSGSETVGRSSSGRDGAGAVALPGSEKHKASVEAKSLEICVVCRL